ncbi:unnamed protein product [Didymodactylos carnosus]|uniref:Uncharacterized protein n=1 Tax=Didymodactylos carnosus TaxID=1234261 RepID=A0A814HSU4_9BILA|nr:unnamed protein product [Didymodactylos carnosus]CAF1014226.1 unnamed protein product [Didymodactylos carnosus]CAF3612915.1 unnamed protein product [Didymodactylos carnosus]CAF3785747.1 unnamed protein product [Didymodactylos carnosus]
MSDIKARIDEYIPTKGLLYFDEELKYVISKPKIMPLKSITLEKLETLQNDAEEKLKQQEKLGQEFSTTF